MSQKGPCPSGCGERQACCQATTSRRFSKRALGLSRRGGLKTQAPSAAATRIPRQLHQLISWTSGLFGLPGCFQFHCHIPPKDIAQQLGTNFLCLFGALFSFFFF